MRKAMPISRRSFIKKTISMGAGMTLSVSTPVIASSKPFEEIGKKDHLTANAFVSVSADNSVTIKIKHIEFGQGTFTGLATLAAEEMDADWDQIVAESAPANKDLYSNLFFGSQATGGSTAIANSYIQMREAGAVARHMLVAAAAERWSVPISEITVKRGVISHSNGQSASFGELAVAAGQQAVPENVILKDPSTFTLIGADHLSRKDMGKTDGTAIFTQDIKLPKMLTAVVAHPPRFGAKVKTFSATKTKMLDGTVQVVEIATGIAVIADNFWNAKKGRDVLDVEWDTRGAMREGSLELMRDYRIAAEKSGTNVVSTGDIELGFETAAKIIEAEYEYPYLAHATMEPMNCVVKINKSGAEIWNGSQSPTSDQNAVAALIGVSPEQVKVHSLFAGGSFGRRYNKDNDYVLEAARIAQAVGIDIPVKLVWTREDDTNAGYFRPMYFHKMKAGLDSDGKITAWKHKIVGQSVLSGSAFSALIKDGIDTTSVEGATELPYSIPNFSVELTTTESQVPVLWWRSVGSTHTAHSVETFMDQLASAAGQDPLSFRLSHLSGDARYRGVLDLAADKANWNGTQPDGRIKGLAVHKSFGTYVAQVSDLSITSSGDFKVDKVVCVVDCGLAVNPDIIKAQMEGGMGYGLSPALMSEITIKNGGVVESNFDAHKVLRIDDMPEMEVYIVPSSEPPTGVGEPGTPVIAPSIANALFSKTGRPQRKLPLRMKL
tara:strand:- start:327 stop:2489 length:2163 start_codon:yes stop_codon:yes gene_type:complete